MFIKFLKHLFSLDIFKILKEKYKKGIDVGYKKGNDIKKPDTIKTLYNELKNTDLNDYTKLASIYQRLSNGCAIISFYLHAERYNSNKYEKDFYHQLSLHYNKMYQKYIEIFRKKNRKL